LAYVADHVVHVWCRINKLGHMMRYIQLEKSKVRPLSPRYIFEIVKAWGSRTPIRWSREVTPSF
jgi:hypothetical protein